MASSIKLKINPLTGKPIIVPGSQPGTIKGTVSKLY